MRSGNIASPGCRCPNGEKGPVKREARVCLDVFVTLLVGQPKASSVPRITSGRRLVLGCRRLLSHLTQLARHGGLLPDHLRWLS